MHVTPGCSPFSVALEPSSFSPRVVVEGLPADALVSLLRGRAAGRSAWRPGVVLAARVTGETDPEDKPRPREIALDDGRVLLRSGASSEVHVDETHVLGDVLQPVSLNLLLAQQWARTGLMLVHGAAFEINGTGVLALGERGAGKSVLAAAVLAAGGRVVSDDWVMLGRPGQGLFRAERLRDFMMFREGWATRTLLDRLNELRSVKHGERRKYIVHIDNERAPTFPDSVHVDRIWLLRRPRTGRIGESRRSVAAPVDALQMIVRATMPVLFSHRFPEEQRALLRAARQLTQTTTIDQVSTGSDLVEAPVRTLTGHLALPGCPI